MSLAAAVTTTPEKEKQRRAVRSRDSESGTPGKNVLVRINSWVRVLPVCAAKRARAADRSAASAPALVSALLGAEEEGGPERAAVVYPNPLVLLTGFVGPPLKRLVVPITRLRPLLPGSDTAELQQLESRLLEALRTPSRSVAKETAEGSKAAADSLLSKGARSDATVQASPDASTSAEEVQGRLGENAVSCGLQEVPRQCETSTPAPPANGRASQTSGTLLMSGARKLEFTAAVGKAFRHATEGRMTRSELTVQLNAFTEDEINRGFVSLEAANKILICDELVFAIL